MKRLRPYLPLDSTVITLTILILVVAIQTAKAQTDDVKLLGIKV
jgi:hypothetical protein